MDSDCVLVMDWGIVVECDILGVFFENKYFFFYGFVYSIRIKDN